MATKQKAKASTQEHLDIEDIVDDLVLLKTGWVALVMSTTAVNFDLLSEAEQDATIYAYGAFLNSLSFPLEVLVRSKKADITSYFNSLEEAESTQPNPDLKRQIAKYKDFIQSTVQQRTVLDKKFYLAVNFSPLEMGFAGIRLKAPTGAKSKTELLIEARTTLMPKRDHIIKQTARLGLVTKQLTTQELVELFYDIYNPAPTGTQRVLLDTSSYTTPIVEPALEVPTPAPSFAKASEGEPMSIDQQAVAQTPQVGEPALRPVAPQAPVPSGTGQAPMPSGPREGQVVSSQLPTTQSRPPATEAAGNVGQTEAFKNLQEATARAAGVLNRPVTSNATGLVGNQYQINVNKGEDKQSGDV